MVFFKFTTTEYNLMLLVCFPIILGFGMTFTTYSEVWTAQICSFSSEVIFEQQCMQRLMLHDYTIMQE